MEPLGQGPGRTPDTNYGLGNIPILARGGAVLPTRDMRSAYLPYSDPLIWAVVPGAVAGSGKVYEDDGETFSFQTGESMLTDLSYTTTGSRTTVHISAGNGTFAGAPTKREHQVWFRGAHASLPKAASCDGMSLKPTDVGSSPGYWLDGQGGVVVACDPNALVSVKHTVVVDN